MSWHKKIHFFIYWPTVQSGLVVFTTLDRPLTPTEFLIVDDNAFDMMETLTEVGFIDDDEY